MNRWNLVFPEFFPDNCPPEDAINNRNTFYRLCKNNERVTSEDFISYYENNPERWKSNILAYGLSVLSNKEESFKLLKLPANKKKFKGVAEGVIESDMGVTKKTPRNNKYHCTWWMCKNVVPENSFVIITQ
ncbi:hypothetical protein [Clostridium butyricum]|uniref:hypothetical protein n=1 Tax=Clostridium butyricum TaxID=1492 RepID=UPI002AB03F48|nr:hypothetical protein [Clostridium butyricum]